MARAAEQFRRRLERVRGGGRRETGRRAPRRLLRQEVVADPGQTADHEAELYRAHAFETFDTCFVRARCDGDVELRIAATHTGSGNSRHEERVECDGATIVYKTGNGYRILDRDGVEVERGENVGGVLVDDNLRAYFAYVRGESPRPLTRLVDARPFVHLNALAYVAAGAVTDFGGEFTRRPVSHLAAGKSEDCLTVEGVDEACETFARTGVFAAG